MKPYLLLCLLLQMGANSLFAQSKLITVSGAVKDQSSEVVLFATIAVFTMPTHHFIKSVWSDDAGNFSINELAPGNYVLEVQHADFSLLSKSFYIGGLSPYLDLGTLQLSTRVANLNDVRVATSKESISSKLDKKVFSLDNLGTQKGASVMQALQNLPGVSMQDGKLQLRGSDKILVLIDGQQTALTGFGNQTGLDNLSAASLDKIEIINNPSAKYDANGNAGIINLVFKKNKEEGLHGKIGMSFGLGALWQKHGNNGSITAQYQQTPKINPSIQVSFRKKKLNLFAQVDNLYTQTLNKNEFVKTLYADGTEMNYQIKRNRNTNFFNSKFGVDWTINKKNVISVSGLYGTETILDHGEQGFYNSDIALQNRLWRFIENEVKTTAMVSVNYNHAYAQAGHSLSMSFNYSFHREDEQYYFENILPSYTSNDSFKLLSDEYVTDFMVNYLKPLRRGNLELGYKWRYRNIPTNMHFIPGFHSPLDTNAGGWANYNEQSQALYGNYILEVNNYAAEIGMRVENVKIQYDVNPLHNTYKSGGYSYFVPFPTMRFSYKKDEHTTLSFFYNKRVDRPNEVDIRIFPKYDDAAVIKVGNPNLQAQFTNSFEIAAKHTISNGSINMSLFHKIVDGTITRIASTDTVHGLIYNVFQNAGRSFNSGLEVLFSKKFSSVYSLSINGLLYRNQINAFTVWNQYPVLKRYSAAQQVFYSGNFKIANTIKWGKNAETQINFLYYAPDIIPQGKTLGRFSCDLAFKKTIANSHLEWFINASDLFNTMNIRKQIQGDGFTYSSNDYYETQVIRVGITKKF